VARRYRRRIKNADKFVTTKPQRCRYEWEGGFSSGTLYCEDVTSGFSTTCIRVPNLNPGRYTSCWSKWPRGLSVGLRPLTQWDCGFESSWGRGCLSLVSVVCCQVEIFASGWSLVQRSPTECGVSNECDREAP